MVSLHKPVVPVEGAEEEQVPVQGSQQTGPRRRFTRRTLLPTLIALALFTLLVSTVSMANAIISRSEPGATQAADTAASVLASTDGTARLAPGSGFLEYLPGEEVAGASRPVRPDAGAGFLEFLPGEEATRNVATVRPEAGVGPVEYLPGEADSSLPPLAPRHEPSPEFGPQP